jgi:hypothetical protein
VPWAAIADPRRPVTRYAPPNTLPVARCATARLPCRAACAPANRAELRARAPSRPTLASRSPSPSPRQSASSLADCTQSTTLRASTFRGGTLRSPDGEILRRARVTKTAAPARQPRTSASPSGRVVGSSAGTGGATTAAPSATPDHASRRTTALIPLHRSAGDRATPRRDRRRRATSRPRGRRSRRSGPRQARAPQRRAACSAPRGPPRAA